MLTSRARRELTQQPRLDIAPLILTMCANARELVSRHSEVEGQLVPLRWEFEDAGRQCPSRHEEVLTAVIDFCERVRRLPPDGILRARDEIDFWRTVVPEQFQTSFPAELRLDQNLLQKWLAGVQLEFDRFLMDTDSPPHFKSGVQGGLAFEWRQASARRTRPRPPRAQLPPEDQRALARKTPGRKPDEKKAQIRVRLKQLRSEEIPWKEIPKLIKNEFGRTLSLGTLQKYSRQSNGTK